MSPFMNVIHYAFDFFPPVISKFENNFYFECHIKRFDRPDLAHWPEFINPNPVNKQFTQKP